MNSNFKIKQTPPVFEDFVMSALNSEIKPDNTVLKKISLSPPEDIAIEAKHLTKIYKTKNKEFVAADDINFKIKKGEISSGFSVRTARANQQHLKCFVL